MKSVEEFELDGLRLVREDISAHKALLKTNKATDDQIDALNKVREDLENYIQALAELVKVLPKDNEEINIVCEIDCRKAINELIKPLYIQSKSDYVNKYGEIPQLIHPIKNVVFSDNKTQSPQLSNNTNASPIGSIIPAESIIVPVVSVELKSLYQQLVALDPNQRFEHLTNDEQAKQEYIKLVAGNQHADIWSLIKLEDYTDIQRAALFKITLEGYQKHQKQQLKGCFALFSTLGKAKNALVNTALNNSADNDEALFSKIDNGHQQLACKANRLLPLSNRWKIRANFFGKKWDENTDSRLGAILTKFRKGA